MSISFSFSSMIPRVCPARACATAAAVLLALGCTGDVAVAPPPSTDASRMYWALTLDYHAVTLSTVAPYDTIRLTATPRTVDGTALTDLPAPTWTSLDLDRAYVSPDGLVRVLGVGSDIPVVATLTVGNLRHADTVLINVTDAASPPVLATFSIQPDTTVGESALMALSEYKVLTARATASDSTPIFGLAVYYTSLDKNVATVERGTGFVRPVRPGHARLTATATAYGVTKSDTLDLVVGYPTGGIIIQVVPRKNAGGQMVNGFDPDSITVGPDAILLFQNSTDAPTDITFDDPTDVAQADIYCGFLPYFCGTGNIDAWARDPADETGLSAVRARRFPVPGTYTYHSTLFGTTGTIVVVNEPDDIP
jgi:hypothetical protein